MPYIECPNCGQSGHADSHQCAPKWNCWDKEEHGPHRVSEGTIIYAHSAEGAACEAAAKWSDYGSERPFEGKLFVRPWDNGPVASLPALLFDMTPSFHLTYEATPKSY